MIEAGKKGGDETQEDQPSQSVEEIMRIIQEAKTPGLKTKGGEKAGTCSSNVVDVDVAGKEVDVSGRGRARNLQQGGPRSNSI